MKISKKLFMNSLKRLSQSTLGVALVFALGAVVVASAADIGKTFATPEEAVAALVAAASAADTNSFRVIFGPLAADIQNPDRVQAAAELSQFNAAINQGKRIVHESDSKCVLEIGENSWPFPVPIVKKNGQWFFDTAAG